MPNNSKKLERNRLKKQSTDPVVLDEAVELLLNFEGAKFDETVELAVKLGIDPKNSQQAVRGAVSLPHGIGKKVRVIAFADGDAAKQAEAAGAIEVGAEDLAKKIVDGWMDFDVAIAHPSMMRHVGKLGRILGPHGKMPAPKSGTVTDEVGRAVEEFVAGKVEFRSDGGGNVHAPVGKKSFKKEQLVANVEAFLEHLQSVKPASAKGIYIQRAAIAATMSPGVSLVVSG
ncbi:MAG: 50S ribosomal protein L1 [Planctomycetes bacterium]|nr:50S ribosomal protein L1 [Planctomycetota bacterium]